MLEGKRPTPTWLTSVNIAKHREPGKIIKELPAKCWLKAPLSFHLVLYAMLMTTDVSQVGVALFTSNIFIILPFYIFLLY
jgi:hypothetical protein